jgi:thioredoxin 1
MAREFTDSNFENTVLSSSKVTLVDFWAQWCGPCRAIAPAIETLSTEFEGRALVGKVDVDQNPEVAMKYGVRSIPTILFIKNGEVVDKQVGAASIEVLRKKLEAHL